VGVTDINYWLGVIVYNALKSHIEVMWILHSTWPNDLPLHPILPMAFRLAIIGGSGCDLWRDTH